MCEYLKFRKEHIIPMVGQKSNPELANWLDNGHAQEMQDHKGSFTFMVGDKVAICGGIIEYWRDRGYLWAAFNEDFKSNFVPVFRGIAHFIKTMPCKRLETAVPVGFELGHRRAKLLGFKVECELAPKFFEDGQDGVVYAMVRG